MIGVLSKLDFSYEKHPFLYFLGCGVRFLLYGACSSSSVIAVKLDLQTLNDLMDVKKSIQIELGVLLDELRYVHKNVDCSRLLLYHIQTRIKMEYSFEEICSKNLTASTWQKNLGDICRAHDHFISEKSMDNTSDDINLITFRKLRALLKDSDVLSSKLCEDIKSALKI